jgi:hypothetical protein
MLGYYYQTIWITQYSVLDVRRCVKSTIFCEIYDILKHVFVDIYNLHFINRFYKVELDLTVI